MVVRREADRLCFCPTAGNWRLPTPEAGSFAIASGHNPSWPFPRHYIALAQPKGGPFAVIDTVSKAQALGAISGKHPVRLGRTDRTSVVQGKSVDVRVVPGGGRSIKKK